MKILSTGDWHIGAGCDEDIEKSLSQILARLSDRDIGLLVVTGDIYERTSTVEMREIACRWMQLLTQYCPALVIRGNHDAIGDLKLLTKLKSDHAVTVDETPSVMYAVDCSPERITAIHTLPWFTKAGWITYHPEHSKESGDQSVSELAIQFLRSGIATAESKFDHEIHQILVAHCMIAGARLQNHQTLIGDGVSLGQYDIPEAGFDAAILGHVHLKQEFGHRPVFYNGSICALNYGETPEKYYSILDTENLKVEFVRLQTVNRETIEATWSNSKPTFLSDLSHIVGSKIRVTLLVEEGENGNLAASMVKEFIMSCGAIEVKVSPQIIPKEQVRAIEVARAKTMKQKLQELWLATTPPEQRTQDLMIQRLGELEEECDR